MPRTERLRTFLKRAAAIVLAFAAISAAAGAHGVIGARFFPATIATDDPFAADELALPTVTVFDHETDYEFEYAKSIVPGFAVSVGGGYADASPPGEPHQSGFTNLEITPLVELYRNAEHESILTAGFSWEIGGSGSRTVADGFSTYTPEILFGKGFGDLPDSVALLRPFAVTSQVGFAIPGSNNESNAVEWGGAVEYSLSYLQSYVEDMGFSPFISRLTPLVEFSFESPTDSHGGGTTGTVNPGLIWSGQQTQFAVEAVLPVNRASGSGVGVTAQLHFYLDDIFPYSIGRPIFGAKS